MSHAFQVVHLRRRPGAPLPPSAKPVPAKRPMSRSEIVAMLSAIKDRARRMNPPTSYNPGAFHEDKSDLVRDIIRLEDAVRLDRQIAE